MGLPGLHFRFLHVGLGLLLILSLGLVACARPNSDTVHQTDISDYGDENETARENQRAPRPVSEPPELLKTGVLYESLPPYQVPERLRTRIEKVQPGFLPNRNRTFQVIRPHLKIETAKSLITFSGVLRIPHKNDEAIELTCTIKKEEVPWICTDMFPTNLKVAAEQRLQGTFKCLDTYSCEKVGVSLWVSIDGKLQPEPQLFQAEGFRILRASSGDVDSENTSDERSGDGAPVPAVEPPKPPGQGTPEPERQSEGLPPAPGSPVPPMLPRPQTPDKVPLPVARPAPIAPGAPIAPVSPPAPLPRPTTVPIPAKPSAPQPPASQPKPVEPPRPTVAPTVTPTVAPTVAPLVETPNLSPEELDDVLANPNAAVEITRPMRLPSPTAGRYSIPHIDKVPAIEGEARSLNQAIGSHTSGSLRQATQLGPNGPGFISSVHGQKDFGTNFTVDILRQALGAGRKQYAESSAIVVANIARKTGGPITPGGGPQSHQNGLDVDIGFPSRQIGFAFLVGVPAAGDFAKY